MIRRVVLLSQPFEIVGSERLLSTSSAEFSRLADNS